MKQPTNGKKPKKIGRPTMYSVGLARRICKRLGEGQPLTRICKEEGMPSITTVYRWLEGRNDKGRESKEMVEVRSAFGPMIARARMDMADTIAAEIIEIADDSEGDRVTRLNDKGKPYTVTDYDNIHRSKLRVDARKWVASKLKPRLYGEKVTAEVSGVDGAPIKTESVVEDATGRLALLRAKMNEAAGVKAS